MHGCRLMLSSGTFMLLSAVLFLVFSESTLVAQFIVELAL